MALLDYRPLYRNKRTIETDFFQSNSPENLDFAREDLARSGLTIEDMACDTPANLRLVDKALAGYLIPYFDLDGQPITSANHDLLMYRVRLKHPKFSRESRYTQPSGEELAKSGLPPVVPYFHPKSFTLDHDYVICAEGEKKTAAILKHLRIPAFGIGGCQMWRDPQGSGGIHPWIKEYLNRRNFKSIVIVPDGDIFRYDICKAYGTFAHELEALGFKVRIANCPGKIDDLILEWGDKANQNFDSLKYLEPSDLVQTPNSLIEKYGLAFKRGPKEQAVVYQHTSNLVKLLEEHPAFPKIWRNADTDRVMVGDACAVPNATEMQLANFFQHNLGFDRVTYTSIFACMGMLAQQNSKSPMLEYIQSQVWDGVGRLDSWLQRLWGVEDSKFHREIASKFLIASCARMHKPGTKIDWMMITVGPQGTGKTSMPGILFRGNNVIIYGEQQHKDLHMLLHSGLVAIFDELDSFNKREASNLKAMVSAQADMYRRPYASSVDTFPRRFMLYGCGNKNEFLTYDPSGYRRYPIVKVERKLDFAQLEAERDQLWAEAWVRYQAGIDQYWEVAGASANAENHVAESPLSSQVSGWLEVQKINKASTNIKDGKFYFTLSQLITGIGAEHQLGNPHITREITGILRDPQINAQCGNTRRSPVPGVPPGRYYTVNLD